MGFSTRKICLDAMLQFTALFAVALMLQTGARLYFFLENQTFFNVSKVELLSAFLHGIRFDASVLGLISAVPILIVILLSWYRGFYQHIWKYLYALLAIGFAVSLVVNIIDAHYFPYTGKRSGPEALLFAKEAAGQLSSLAVTYWPAILVSLGLVIFLYFVARAIRKIELRHFSWLWYLPACAVLFFSVALIARGSLDSKPLNPAHAYGLGNVALAPLINNSMFNLLKEEPGNLNKKHYFASDAEALSLLKVGGVSEGKNPKKKNVVILILESFGMEYFGPPYSSTSYMPFLSSLAGNSLFFPYAIANGRRSIEALPSIYAGLPSLMVEPFSTSSYQSNTIYGIGNILLDYGYSSAFFHGAKNGSMYFDATSARFGFRAYHGLDEYPNNEDFDGQWGIYDEPFLQYSINKIEEMPKPFLASIFTLSSHPPYSIPEPYVDQIEPGKIPMHKAVRYVDIALSKFFAEARKRSWFENTIFIITADHTSDNWDADFSSTLSRHQIPIIVYANDVDAKVDKSIVQQADILPSLVDYLQLPEQGRLLPFGQSFFTNRLNEDAIFYDQAAYWLVRGGRYVKINKLDDQVEYGELPKSFAGTDLSTISDEQALERLKAYIQLYTNGLIDNKLYER